MIDTFERSSSSALIRLENKKGAIEAELMSRELGRDIIGVDEVGRGCIAGSVMAAAVILNYKKLGLLSAEDLKLVRDSKTLSSKQRQQILSSLRDVIHAYGTGEATVAEIFDLGIARATFLAMKRSIAQLQTNRPAIILVDGKFEIPDLTIPQIPIVKGDNKVFAIAAASILAKETRDSYMKSQSQTYPFWGFESHMGYGTKNHLIALDKFGICPLHRRNFAPITSFC